MNNFKPGRSCWNGLIRRFLATDKDSFMQSMEACHPYVNPNEISDGKIQSWDECYDSLQQSLGNLVAMAPRFKMQGIVFEYALPLHNNPNKEGLRFLDCAIVGNVHVAILEFKMWTESFIRKRKDRLEWAASEVSNYVTKLETMHISTLGRSIHPAIVLCRENDYVDEVTESSMGEPVRVVSNEALPDALVEWFGRKPMHLKSLVRWHNSGWLTMNAGKAVKRTLVESRNAARETFVAGLKHLADKTNRR